MRRELERAEHVGEGGIANVEPASIGAERRHHHALAVGRKAAARDRAPAPVDPRHRMQVPGDLARDVFTLRRMAEHQWPDPEHRRRYAAEIAYRLGIVIAGDPDPVTPALERAEHGAIVVRHALRSLAVVETVAEGDHEIRRIARHQRTELGQRRRRVVGRQQHAAGREARAFFEMQVGDDQEAFFRPVKRTGTIGNQRNAGYDNIAPDRSPKPRALRLHCMASFTSSASASRSSSSDASPWTISRPISSITGTASGETWSRAL